MLNVYRIAPVVNSPLHPTHIYSDILYLRLSCVLSFFVEVFILDLMYIYMRARACVCVCVCVCVCGVSPAAFVLFSRFCSSFLA